MRRCEWSFRSLLQRQPDERVEGGVGSELILGGIYRRAGVGGLEPKICEGGESVGCGTAARARRSAGEADDTQLALKLIGYARGKLGPYAVRAADHRFVVLRDGSRELVGGECRQDRQCQPTPDALNGGQGAEGVAFRRRTKAEQSPRILADLQLGQHCDVPAGWTDRGERLAAELD